jgi:hypothetical protein
MSRDQIAGGLWGESRETEQEVIGTILKLMDANKPDDANRLAASLRRCGQASKDHRDAIEAALSGAVSRELYERVDKAREAYERACNDTAELWEQAQPTP